MSYTEDTDDDSFQSINDAIADAGDYETDDENNEGSGWITLNGCGKTTRWQYPENETRCTDCFLECGSREAAIEHYKEQHAMNMILCYLCDLPIYSKLPDDFQRHYEENQPTTEMPFIFSSTNSKANVSEESEGGIDNETDENESEDEDDLIRLSGCGKITCWLFPKHQKICPIETCNKEFARRSNAIQHYRAEHSNNSIFCYLCEKPILALCPNDFKRHYKSAHPNIEMAFCFDEKLSTSSREIIEAKKDVNDDEVITLNGCGYVTQWHISDTTLTRCPIMSCQKQFKLRSHAILHFKKIHAAGSICCPTCRKPVLAQNFSDFAEHYKGQDEKDLILLSDGGQISQWKFPSSCTRCPVRSCYKEFTSRANAITHYKSAHANKSIFCNLCDRPYVVQHPHHFVHHFRSHHPDAELPYQFNFKEYSKKSCEETNMHLKDVIQLRGCGLVTHWSFPKTEWEKCHLSGCYSRFDSRSEAITHYKTFHTENFVLCELCNKPIRAFYPVNFKLHYRSTHPNEKIPYEFNRRKKTEIANDDEDDDDEDDDDDKDDLITLKELGYITLWKFPKKNNAMSIQGTFLSRGIHYSNSCDQAFQRKTFTEFDFMLNMRQTDYCYTQKIFPST